MASVTHQELEAAIKTVEAVAQTRADKVQDQMAEIRVRMASIDASLVDIVQRLARMETDARWFRLFAATALGLGAAYAKGWL